MTKMEMQDASRVAVIMGRKNDWALHRAVELLSELGVACEAKVVPGERAWT